MEIAQISVAVLRVLLAANLKIDHATINYPEDSNLPSGQGLAIGHLLEHCLGFIKIHELASREFLEKPESIDLAGQSR